MKSFPLLAAAILPLIPMLSHAQEVRRVALDGTENVSTPPEIGDAHGIAHIAHVPTPLLEIYPATAKPSHGTILVSPGGGYRFLSISKEGRDVAAMLNRAGWDAAVLFYPVEAGSETRSLALDAAKKAWELLQKRGGEFGLSTARMGAMGFSAGGHLTARLAHETTTGGTAPSFLVLMYPAYLEKDGKLLDDVAPTNVPTFLCVGEKDTTYKPSSDAYVASCKEKGIPCDFTVAPGTGHGFGLTTNLPAGARDWPDKLKAFLASLK